MECWVKSTENHLTLVFLLMSFECSLYILNTNPASYVTCKYFLSLVVFFIYLLKYQLFYLSFPWLKQFVTTFHQIIWNDIKIISEGNKWSDMIKTGLSVKTLWEGNIWHSNAKKPMRRTGRQREEQGKHLLVVKSLVSSR